MTSPRPIYLTYEQAAERLAIPRGTLGRWVHERKIPHHRLGDRTVRFLESELRSWLAFRHNDVSRSTVRSHRRSLVSDEYVAKIRQDYTRGATQVDLAAKYGVSQSTISNILGMRGAYAIEEVG